MQIKTNAIIISATMLFSAIALWNQDAANAQLGSDIGCIFLNSPGCGGAAAREIARPNGSAKGPTTRTGGYSRPTKRVCTLRIGKPKVCRDINFR
jgi:hypothetical protein